MAECYGWTLAVIDDLSVWTVKRLGDASARIAGKRKPLEG
jgi:hypothetical protein